MKLFILYSSIILPISFVVAPLSTPPTLTNKSASLVFTNEGDTVELFCEVSGIPEPAHSWLKNGLGIFPSERVYVTVSGAKNSYVRLVIKRFKKYSDSAIYSCHFRNFVGNVSHYTKVTVPEKHWIISDNVFIKSAPKNWTTIEAGRIKLPCLSDGFPSNITHRWFFNNVNVLATASLKQRIQILPDGSLVINSLVKEDGGWYTCSPTNNLGRPPEAKAYLNVTYLPKIIGMPGQTYLARNMVGKLGCEVDSNPPTTLIRWFKDNRPIDLSTHSHIHLSTDSKYLFMKPASNHDEGDYYCVPYSSLGQGQTSPSMQVFVRDPPYFTLRPRPIYQRQPTQSVIMACKAEGDPRPTIEWKRVDVEYIVPSKWLHNDGNLTVVNLSKEDHGYYECIASNLVSNIVATTLVIIELITPHPPTNVTVVPSTDHAQISWLPAYDGGFPLHYLLWYRPVLADNTVPWATIRLVYSNLTSIIMHHLKEDTPYQFMVLSRSSLGDGLFSEVVESRTLSSSRDVCASGDCYITAAPVTDFSSSSYLESFQTQDGLKPPKPINLTARFVKSHLIISWSLPSFADSNIYLPIHHFSLQYRTVGQWVSLVERLTGTTSYNWTTVSRGVTYQFRVSAHSKLPKESKFVPGEFSDVHIFQTGDPMHSDSPVTDQTLGAVIALLFVSGILLVLIIVFLKKLCSRITREKSRKGTESNSHVYPANASDLECSNTFPETESLCKPISKIKETPI